MGRALRTSILLAAATLAGCALWRPDWTVPAPRHPSANVASLVARAEDASGRAGNRAGLEEVMEAWRAVLSADPSHYAALTSLANQQILLGAAYARTPAERVAAYRDAMTLAARAMATNPDFRRSVEEGNSLWDAADRLGAGELDAMGFWVTALFYYYKDCQGAVGQVVHFRWVSRARRVMERMTALDADWGGGMLHFLWGIYYLAIPESVGGDRAKSAASFARAIEVGPTWLQHRWGRGRYYFVKMGDPEASRRDLEWVVAQPLESSAGPYAWRVYIQRDARSMLVGVANPD